MRFSRTWKTVCKRQAASVSHFQDYLVMFTAEILWASARRAAVTDELQAGDIPIQASLVSVLFSEAKTPIFAIFWQLLSHWEVQKTFTITQEC